VRAHSEDGIQVSSQRLAELRDKAAEIERELSDARLSLEREIAQSQPGQEMPADWPGEGYPEPPAGGEECGACSCADPDACCPDPDFAWPGQEIHADAPHLAGERTETLVSRGRSSAARHGLARWHKIVIAAGAAASAITVMVLVLAGGGASWPPSVARMRGEITRACHNPDVRSEPGQVNFACARDTQQVLWVFALLTSGGDPAFSDPGTGRAGLEPITPAQGGEIAWSLNLHHPYDPASPIDSLQVAARAINNIIGGATVTGASGTPVVQPGLESTPSNCLRYTGSAAVTRHQGFPATCAKPVSNPAGQAALVADVYQKWVAGAAPGDAQDAAVLFANADNPGDPQVQAIVRRLAARRG
jgi:hypothetical protein